MPSFDEIFTTKDGRMFIKNAPRYEFTNGFNNSGYVKGNNVPRTVNRTYYQPAPYPQRSAASYHRDTELVALGAVFILGYMMLNKTEGFWDRLRNFLGGESKTTDTGSFWSWLNGSGANNSGSGVTLSDVLTTWNNQQNQNVLSQASLIEKFSSTMLQGLGNYMVSPAGLNMMLPGAGTAAVLGVDTGKFIADEYKKFMGEYEKLLQMYKDKAGFANPILSGGSGINWPDRTGVKPTDNISQTSIAAPNKNNGQNIMDILNSGGFLVNEKTGAIISKKATSDYAYVLKAPGSGSVQHNAGSSITRQGGKGYGEDKVKIIRKNA